jgi:hypothetical protein
MFGRVGMGVSESQPVVSVSAVIGSIFAPSRYGVDPV